MSDAVPTSTGSSNTTATMGFRPLYQQVRDTLTRRIADGTWRGGDMVPSEFQIAAELGVSQGTIRKALDDMTAAKLLVRRQGKGTFVATHDEARILFQFFKLKPDTGEQIFPESEVLSVDVGSANLQEQLKLDLSTRDEVIRIRRARSLGGVLSIIERIVLPRTPFEGLQMGDIPNNLYQVYAERYGVTIAGGHESLKAVAASPEEATILGLETGGPLLLIDRVATSLEGRPMEWRLSACSTKTMQYATELR